MALHHTCISRCHGASGMVFTGVVLFFFALAGPVCCASSNSVQRLQQILTGKAIVLSLDFGDHSSQRKLFVHTPSGKRVPVEVGDDSQLDGLHTGMSIQLRGDWQQEQQAAAAASIRDGSGSAPDASARRGHFRASRIHASRPAITLPSTTIIQQQPGGVSVASQSVGPVLPPVVLSSNPVTSAELSTLVVPIVGVTPSGDACQGTEPAQFSVEQVRRAVFQEGNADPSSTVGGIYNSCSYGKTQLTLNNSMVADPVHLPCSGNTNGVVWSMATCGWDDFPGYADAADEVLRARGVDLSSYKHRIYLVPPGPCKWVGLGYIGCDGQFPCRSWIGGHFWDSANAMVHEMGHNMFLAHASDLTPDGTFDEYGDDSCAMGYCCSQRCFNTPHAWQLGWISVQELDSSSLAPGQTVNATLASQATSARSGVRILPEWAASSQPMFLGFRTASMGDNQLGGDFDNRLGVWTAPIYGNTDYNLTTLRASLTVGQSWEYAPAKLTVRFLATSGGAAAVSVCRAGGQETAASCSAGVDNDCNGFAGPADPACMPFLGQLRSSIRPEDPRLTAGSKTRRPSPPPETRRQPRRATLSRRS